MGYSYMRGRLVCDHCGRTGGVRKRRCPANWCPPPAYCSDCYALRKGDLAMYHVRNDCAGKSRAFQEEMAARGRAVVTNGETVELI